MKTSVTQTETGVGRMHETAQSRPSSYPCLTAEIIDMMATANPVRGIPADKEPGLESLSPGGKLLLHFGVFLIASWNLLAINLANSPNNLWFWPWVAAWAGALVLHFGIVLVPSSRRRCKNADDGSSRGAASGGHASDS
jgi:hypothetical protein